MSLSELLSELQKMRLYSWTVFVCFELPYFWWVALQKQFHYWLYDWLVNWL